MNTVSLFVKANTFECKQNCCLVHVVDKDATTILQRRAHNPTMNPYPATSPCPPLPQTATIQQIPEEQPHKPMQTTTRVWVATHAHIHICAPKKNRPQRMRQIDIQKQPCLQTKRINRKPDNLFRACCPGINALDNTQQHSTRACCPGINALDNTQQHCSSEKTGLEY